MQMCPDCGEVYDESEYAGCPSCNNYGYDDEPEYVIVYDHEAEEAKSVPRDEAYLYE